MRARKALKRKKYNSRRDLSKEKCDVRVKIEDRHIKRLKTIIKENDIKLYLTLSEKDC